MPSDSTFDFADRAFVAISDNSGNGLLAVALLSNADVGADENAALSRIGFFGGLGTVFSG